MPALTHEINPLLLARAQLKGVNVSAPIETAVARYIFSSEYHAAATNRVHTYRAVIAPASQTIAGLNATPAEDRCFVAKRSGRITSCAKGITDIGNYRCARNVVADSDVSRFIHGCTAHPSVGSVVWCIGALLINDRGRVRERAARRISQFIPPNAGGRACRYGMIHYHDLVSTDLPIAQAIVEPIP